MPRQRNVKHVEKKEASEVDNRDGKEIREQKTAATTPHQHQSLLRRLFGVETTDFSNWSSFVAMLNSGKDPSSLAVFRIGFGLLMSIDVLFERGLSQADYRFGDNKECRFPLFDFLQPLSLPWMYVVYLGMILGAIGIMLGLLFRFSCALYLCTYWYVYILDKTLWNNHSYLYGLCAWILLLSDANRYWSLDTWIRPRLQNTAVPLWNYTLLRTQFFLVYFLAGLKKLDPDWMAGYSMQSLSHHWVFKPFSYFLTYDQVDLFIVHHGGFLYDLSAGFLLFFDITRPIGVAFSLMFHTMNSQMFTIGLFPYVMMASLPVFSSFDWPKQIINQVPQFFKKLFPSANKPQPSQKCVKGISRTSRNNNSIRLSHQVTAVFTISYIAVQCFLPYSHFLTPGYNTWTNGLYGYSWDMMVHTWTTQHMRITYKDRHSGDSGFLKPDAWTRGQIRWSSHSDMIKQYAHCIAERLETHELRDVELYFDVWRSLNDRFQQRMFDPRVDILKAPWSPWSPTPWLMPLLSGLSHWRQTLDQMEKEIYNSSNEVDVVFMADFPGLSVENFLQPELGNCSVQVLEGVVVVELVSSERNYTLKANDSMKLPSGEYHNVHTISDTPSCFMYKYTNTTEQSLQKELHNYEQKDQTRDDPNTSKMTDLHRHVQERRDMLMMSANSTTWDRVSKFFSSKFREVQKSAIMTGIALKSLATRQSFEHVFNMTVGQGESWY